LWAGLSGNAIVKKCGTTVCNSTMTAGSFDLSSYVALSQDGGFVELPAWSSVSIRGRDRQGFAHNFCTNDIRRLLPGQCCEAFVTNVKGKILGHGLFTCREEEIVIITTPEQGPKLVAHLERYIIREDVEVRDTTGERAYLLLAGGPPARHAFAAWATAGKSTALAGENLPSSWSTGHTALAHVAVHWIRWDLLGDVFCLLLEVKSTELARVCQAFLAGESVFRRVVPQCSQEAFQALRIEAGMPLFGIDFDENNLPQEVGRDREAISFTKGCYLGQETVARIDALGHVNQRIAGVRFFGEVTPPSGMELLAAGGKVGRVTFATYSPRLGAPLALAMVRCPANTPGTRLESPLGPCEVVALPLGSSAPVGRSISLERNV